MFIDGPTGLFKTELVISRLFDNRGNPEISLEDISLTQIVDYLHSVGSNLANDLIEKGLESVLEQRDIFVGPKENRMIKNVAAIMFCPNPEKFFPYPKIYTDRNCYFL